MLPRGNNGSATRIAFRKVARGAGLVDNRGYTFLDATCILLTRIRSLALGPLCIAAVRGT
jgi:hypothetical protein